MTSSFKCKTGFSSLAICDHYLVYPMRKKKKKKSNLVTITTTAAATTIIITISIREDATICPMCLANWGSMWDIEF